MKKLKLLWSTSFILLFTPFVQLCSDNNPEPEASASDTVEVSTTKKDNTELAHQEVAKEENTEKPSQPSPKKSILEATWERLTIYGDNWTATGFGLVVLQFYALFDGQPSVGLMTMLMCLSLLLTLIGGWKIFRRKTRTLHSFYIINSVITLALGIILIIDPGFSQIKWGYYAYLINILSLTILSIKSKMVLS